MRLCAPATASSRDETDSSRGAKSGVNEIRAGDDVEPVNGQRNGSKVIANLSDSPPPLSPPPAVIAELAEGCVRHVERAVGVKLDYQPETLPILDHYLVQSRQEARARPEVLSLIAQTSGAYLGEVVRRRYASWWSTEGTDPTEWQIELEAVYLAFSPVRIVLEALLRAGAADRASGAGAADRASGAGAADRASGAGATSDKNGGGDDARAQEGSAPDEDDEDEEEEESALGAARLELEEEDHEAVMARLAELPPVSEDEFYATSTRLEVIDIAIEAIRARRMAAGEDAERMLRPEDYGG
jgi:hypothetical protein